MRSSQRPRPRSSESDRTPRPSEARRSAPGPRLLGHPRTPRRMTGILLSGWVRWVQARGMSPGRLLQARSFGYPPPGADEASHNASGWTASCSPATGGVIAETRRGPASTPRGQFRFRCGVAACPMAAATATPVSARRPVRDREQLGRQRIQIDLITEPSGERLNGPGVARCYAGSWQAVSSLSAAIPCAASRRTAAPGSVTLLSRADVVPYEAATDLAKGCAWPDTEGVTGSNPVAPTTPKRRSGRVFSPGLTCSQESLSTESSGSNRAAPANNRPSDRALRHSGCGGVPSGRRPW